MSNQTLSTHLHKPALAILAALMLGASQQLLYADTIQITGNAVNGFGNLDGDDTAVNFTLTINISGLPVATNPPLQPLSGTVIGFQSTTSNAVSVLTGVSALPTISDSGGYVEVQDFGDSPELDFQAFDSTGNYNASGYFELPDGWTGTTPALANNCCDSSELNVNLQFPGDPGDTGSYLFYVQVGESEILSSATPEPNMFGPIALAAGLGLAGTFRRTRRIGG